MTQPVASPDRRALLGAALTAAVGVARAAPGAAFAQAERPIRFVLPNATGSGVDAITRAVQPALAKALGHPIVVENQPGAGGVLGLSTIARAAPDGFTLGVVSNNVVIFPSVLKQLPFDMPGDFTPIALVGSTPMVIVVNPQRVPAKNAREFAQLLKDRKGDMTFGSGGNGTILHLAGEMLVDEMGAKARHIPYKGVGPMVSDLIGGQIDFAVVALPSAQGQIKGGQLRAIGMATAQRVPAAQDIPTIAEQGFPNYAMEAWFAVIGPKGMAPADVQRIHQAITAAFNEPAARQLMQQQGNLIQVGAADKAMPTFRAELARYAKLVKQAGIEAQ